MQNYHALNPSLQRDVVARGYSDNEMKKSGR